MIDPSNRPHPDKMLPFEWLYWNMIDKGDAKAAEGVRELLRDRDFQREELAWERKRRAAEQPTIAVRF